MRAAVAVALALVALAACKVKDEEKQGKSGPPPAVLPPFEKQQGADVTDDRTRLAGVQDGERLYLRRCGVCHLDGGMGTMILARRVAPEQAKLQDRRDLRPDFVTRVVRQGQGGMPRLTPVDVTDAELQAIANYLARPRP